MKKLLLALVLVTATAHAATGFLVNSYVSGMNRICIYNVLGSSAAVTLQAWQVCPVTWEF